MYEDLTGDTLQAWIRVNENKKLFNGKQSGELIPFIPVKEVPGDEKINKEYPFKAVLNPVRYHLGSGTRTGYSKRIKNFFNDGVMEISPDDAREMNLEETDTVEVS